jgi:hypothetical protein
MLCDVRTIRILLMLYLNEWDVGRPSRQHDRRLNHGFGTLSKIECRHPLKTVYFFGHRHECG